MLPCVALAVEEPFEQANLYELSSGQYLWSMCPQSGTDGMLFVPQFVPQVSTAAVEDVEGIASALYTAFDTPRVLVESGDVISLNATRLYRIEFSHEDHSDHDHSDDHGEDHHSERRLQEHKMRMLSMRRILEACENPVEVSFSMMESSTVVLFTEHRLDTLEAVLQNEQGQVLASSICVGECDEDHDHDDSSDEGLSGSEKWLYTILAALITSLTAFLGIGALLVNRNLLMACVDYLTTFAAGALIAAVLFHIYPEAFAYLSNQPSWKMATCSISGIFLGMLVEQGMHFLLHKHGAEHHHGSSAHECLEENVVENSSTVAMPTSGDRTTDPVEVPKCLEENIEMNGVEKKSNVETPTSGNRTTDPVEAPRFQWRGVKPIVLVVAMGDLIHAITDGILIAIGFQGCNSSTGWLITFAVAMHEIPHRTADFFIFLKSGLSIAQSLLINLFASSGTVFGAMILLTAGDIQGETLGYLVSFSSGTLLFIGLTNLLPTMLNETDGKKTIIHNMAFVAGIITVGLTMLVEDTHCEADGADHSGHNH